MASVFGVFVATLAAQAAGLDITGPPARGSPAGTAIDNSARAEYTAGRDGDSSVLTAVSNTVTTRVEQVSGVDVDRDLDTRFVRPGSDEFFIKRIRNMGNGTDTFAARTRSAILGDSILLFHDADSDGQLSGLDPPFEPVVLPPGTETTVLIAVRLPADLPVPATETISVVVHSLLNLDPAADTGMIVLSVQPESSPIGLAVVRTNPEGNQCPYVLAPQVESGLTPLWVRFNVPIDPASVTLAAIRILEGDGTNRTDSVFLIDDRTVQIRSTYGDTAWPYGSKFSLRIGTGIRNLEVPPDSLPAEHVVEFRTFLNSQARQTLFSTDRMAELRIDTGDIDPGVKGIAVEILPADPGDTQIAHMLDALKNHPYYEFIPGSLPIYDYRIMTHASDRCEDGLAELAESRFKNPVDVSISVRKPGFLQSKGVPLNATNLSIVHFKSNPGEWEALPDMRVQDHGDTVAVSGSARSFSPFGILFAFAPPSVRETFRSFPNPADPFATYTNPSGSWQGFRFGWNMPQAGVITIHIYDFAGQSVRVIGPTAYVAGDYYAQVGATWDGRNGLGQVVLNGVYFVRAEIRYTDGSVEQATDRIAVVK